MVIDSFQIMTRSIFHQMIVQAVYMNFFFELENKPGVIFYVFHFSHSQGMGLVYLCVCECECEIHMEGP